MKFSNKVVAITGVVGGIVTRHCSYRSVAFHLINNQRNFKHLSSPMSAPIFLYQIEL